MPDTGKITASLISRWVGEQKPLIVELERLLTSFPALAPESGGDGELEKCCALEEKLRSLGFRDFERFDAPDPRVPSGIRPNLVVTVPGKNDGVRLWVMSHLDVVPPGDLSKWETDPWTAVEKDGAVYGRGVEDNQQGLVSSVIAALFFIKNGIVPEYTLKLLFMADEENGSVFGMQYLLKECSRNPLFSKSDFIIIPDGGDSLGETIEVAEKNILWLNVIIQGKQSHGSRPDLGINAHHAGCDLALKLHGLERRFSARNPLFEPDYSTFQATKKEANVPNINTIPGEDLFCMDCRILPEYKLDVVRAAVKEVVAEIERDYGVSVSVKEEQAVESVSVSPEAPVVKLIHSAVETVLGRKCRPVGIGGGTVAAYLRNAGYDAVVWSIMDETAHQPNEYSKLDNIIGEASVLAAAACLC